MDAAAVQQHLTEAKRARQGGHVADARRHLEAVVALDPTQPVARNMLGLDALARGAACGAAEHFEQACRGDANAAELWLNLARAHADLDDVEAARAALERALSIDR